MSFPLKIKMFDTLPNTETKLLKWDFGCNFCASKSELKTVHQEVLSSELCINTLSHVISLYYLGEMNPQRDYECYYSQTGLPHL
jgi:hypothetical protein